jgi:hypothetical protein
MDLSTYTIDELITLKNQIISKISSYEDGYVYICNVHSYGNNWVDKTIKNKHALMDLISEFDGQNGVVDVYTTNPNLSGVYNYGELMFIESVQNYERWDNLKKLESLIIHVEKELDKWDNRDNLPYHIRPWYAPLDTREDLSELKKELDEYDMSFVPPRKFIIE